MFFPGIVLFLGITLLYSFLLSMLSQSSSLYIYIYTRGFTLVVLHRWFYTGGFTLVVLHCFMHSTTFSSSDATDFMSLVIELAIYSLVSLTQLAHAAT